jgi:hypothetical protein
MLVAEVASGSQQVIRPRLEKSSSRPIEQRNCSA